jgi:chaperonin GroES
MATAPRGDGGIETSASNCRPSIVVNGTVSICTAGTVPCALVSDEKLPIKMLNDRLLVKIPRDEGERRSSGGILIPATAQVAKRLIWAEVVALGQNVRACEVKDRVLFSPDDRYEVEVQGDDYIMLRERDLHAVAASRIESATGLYL